MIENKDIPKEYVSIRQIWLHNINKCCDAIGSRAKPDASHEAEWQEVGNRTVINSVRALYYSLVDYGEAKIKTDIDKWKIEVFKPQFKEGMSLRKSADLYQIFFERIIQVLNKYGMLFDTKPEGYSNVEMKSI